MPITPTPPPDTEPTSPPSPPTDALQRLLPPDVRSDTGPRHPDVHSATNWRHPTAIDVWHGLVWGRLGRADLAWERFDGVHAPDLQPWIAAERGRILRELGLHTRAEALERPALLAATDVVDDAMLRISLVADAVGVGDAAEAIGRHDHAAAAVVDLPATPRAARQRLRLAWVGVEVAWLSGAAPSSDGLPHWDPTRSTPSYPDDHAWGSDFHTAKGLLFGGIVHDDPRLLDAAARCAPPALLWAVHLARADRGRGDAEEAARTAWRTIRPPPAYDAEVRQGPTAARLTTG